MVIVLQQITHKLGYNMYFIFDCFHNIVGNPKGYRTFKGAKIQHDAPGSPAFNAIYSAFDRSYKRESNNLISEIKYIETGDNVKQALINYYLSR